MTTRIEIDPNVRVGDLTYAGLEDVHGSITIGERVEVFESEADIIGDADIVSIDREKRLVYLDVVWSSLRPAVHDDRRWP